MKATRKIETITIEATAAELQASRTLGDNFVAMLSRCFGGSDFNYDEEEDDEHDLQTGGD